jgi:tripartite-type tricarboxylate transporter receptor subunit TctC
MGAVKKEPMVNWRAFAATACGVVAAAVALLAVLAQACAQARAEQSYPERTVRIIVPTAAGGSIDTTARVVAAALAERWGKPVVIENRPGAAMIIGAEAAAKSPPDGYTLLIAHDGTMAMNPVVYPNLAYHSQRDFEPLALLTSHLDPRGRAGERGAAGQIDPRADRVRQGQSGQAQSCLGWNRDVAGA